MLFIAKYHILDFSIFNLVCKIDVREASEMLEMIHLLVPKIWGERMYLREEAMG